MAEIREIDPNRARAKDTKKILNNVMRRHFEFHGDDIAGFALVTWDMRGGAHSGFLAENGMVSRSLMPAFVHDCLNRHSAVILVEETHSDLVTPDDA